MEGGPDGIGYKLFVTVPLVIGVAGNVAALWILYYTSKRRNAKHVLLLRCLAANDLVSELGMLIVTYIPYSYSKCVIFVLLRAFGLGSGTIAFVMAVERWLALTKPFFYQQHVTYWVLVRFVGTIWSIAVFITYLPLFTKYGLFYEDGQCKRYREAKNDEDVIYAYLFFTFGVFICTVIACCNTMVFWELSRLGSRRKHLVRRTSRSTMSTRVENCREYSTSEERAFATVMAFLGVIFVACWMPQMILIPIAQSEYRGQIYTILSKIANVLLVVYFTVDPYVYVFKHYIDRRKFRLPFKPKRSTTSSTAHGSTPGGTPTTILLSAPSFSATNV